MTNSWPALDLVLIRTVELTATYLVHSTLFFLLAAAVVAILRRKTSPSLTERVWKLVVVLPMLTAPLSVFVGWANPVWNWSLADAPAVMDDVDLLTEAVRPDEPVFLANHSADRARGSTDPIAAKAPSAATVADAGPNATANPQRSKSLKDFIQRRGVTESQREPTRGYVSSLPDGVTVDVGMAIVDEPSPAIESRQIPTSDVVEAIARFGMISGVSACGIVILMWVASAGVYLIWKGISLTLRLRGLDSIDGWLRGELDRIVPQNAHVRLLQMGSGRTQFRQQRSTGCEPFACGLWRWTIVLPQGIEDCLSREELRALLMHEVAHLVRRDPWWQWLGQLACTCLAFQPLNVIARRRWQQAAELLCDDWAVDREVAPTILANCLTRVAEWRLERTGARLSGAGMGLPAVGDTGLLTTRIHWLLRNGRVAAGPRRRFPAFATLATFAAGLLVGMYGPRLVLMPVAEAASVGELDHATEDTWELIGRELSLTRQELARLQSQLAAISDSESNEQVERLLRWITLLMEEVND